MLTHDRAERPSSDSSAEYDEKLKQVNPYILDVVRRKIPRAIVSGEVLDLEIDEIVQRTIIKLWQAMQREQILNVRSYVNRIVYTEVIDFIRRYKPVSPLPLDEDGELYPGHILTTLSHATPDPAEEFEQTEEYYSLIIWLAQALRTLPPKQQQAMICALKDYSMDHALFIEVFTFYDLDIASTQCPQELRSLQSLRASLSIARKKLHALRDAA